MKLIITVGIPASGKTTWANTQLSDTTVISCRDDIRQQICGKFESWEDYKFDATIENQVTEIQKQVVVNSLGSGIKTVILADTNLKLKRISEWITFCGQLVEVELRLFNQDFGICVVHNKNTGRLEVSEAVMNYMRVTYMELIPKIHELYGLSAIHIHYPENDLLGKRNFDYFIPYRA